MNFNSIFTEEQQQFIIDNYMKKSYQEIADELGFTKGQVETWAYRHHFKKNQGLINGHYFDQIDTSLKAYFLGFIYADGTIDIKSRRAHFLMKLQSQDRYVLEKLNQELGGRDSFLFHEEPHKRTIMGREVICHGTDRLSIGSRDLINSLLMNNIVPNKSHSDIFPMVNDEFFFDYLRGYIDGDGTYYINKRGYLIITIICNSEKNLRYIQSKLSEKGIDTRIYGRPDCNAKTLMCSKVKDSRELLNRLYYEDDLFCLQRKYEKVKHLIGLAA